MILYINNENEIKDVNTTNDYTLIPIEIDDERNPFANWSFAKICCYALNIKNGEYRGFYPYVDTRIIEQLERQGQETINLQAQVDYLAMMTDIEIM